MEVNRIRRCLFCKSNIEANVEFAEYQVIQSCPICGQELGRAGAFFAVPVNGGVRATLRVRVKP